MLSATFLCVSSTLTPVEHVEYALAVYTNYTLFVHAQRTPLVRDEYFPVQVEHLHSYLNATGLDTRRTLCAVHGWGGLF